MKRNYFGTTLPPLALALFGTALAQPPLRPLETGHQVFEHWCAPCHAPLTRMHNRLAGTSTLAMIYKGAKPAALEQRTDLTAALIAYYVRYGMNGMPAFRKTEITDAQLAALSEYLSRNNPQK